MTPFRIVVDEPKPVPSGTLLLVPGKNLRTGTKDFGAIYSNITTLENDLLTVSSAIYACDLACKRGLREDITRNIDLTIPVINYSAFKAVKTRLEVALWTLSHDNWTVTFTRAQGTPEKAEKWLDNKGYTILFSGGVDSFAGAVELIEKNGPDAVQLASHLTANPITRESQEELSTYIEKSLGKPQRMIVRTGGTKSGDLDFPSDSDREETQRTRSFMFLSIAALAARRSGHSKIVVIAENGQMAIHLPLSVGRIGAFSTHTAHPDFVQQAAELFSSILDVPLKIENPYLYLTKAEVVARVVPSHTGALKDSVSCWRASRISQFNHCGQCVPCLIRRIAFEKNGVQLKEYERDLLNEDIPNLPETDDGKRNLVEIIEFSRMFATATDAALEDDFPDLISDQIDKPKAIKMYRRFADEATSVLKKYSGPTAVLSTSKKAPRK
jgi:7-cyano-7-deazaguanine synthase in queuosine biosynthesis